MTPVISGIIGMFLHSVCYFSDTIVKITALNTALDKIIVFNKGELYGKRNKDVVGL